MLPGLSILARYGQYLACLSAGCALTLAFAPYNLSLTAILSPAVLFWCWHGSSANKAFVQGYLFGLGFFGTGVNWLHISINLYGGVNLAGALFMTYLLVAFLALYPALTGYLGNKIRCRQTLWLMGIAPALWTLAEWCRSWIFTGFPWINLGYSQTDTILGAIAPVLGIYGVTWLVCLLAALVIILIHGRSLMKMAAITAMACIWAGSALLDGKHWTMAMENEITVALVQPSVSQSLKWDKDQRQRIEDLQMKLSEPHWGSTLLVWPETAIPGFYHQSLPLLSALQALAADRGTGFITGIPYQDSNGKDYYNSILALGGREDIYHKRHLVPFGEYLPFDRWLRPVLDFIRIPMSDFSAGDQVQPLLQAAAIPIGVSICYEDIFGEEVIEALPEAQLLLNISNDAWFGDSLAPHQHLQMARMRARETGRYMLRATNNGISALIDEHGRTLAQLPQFAPGVLTGTARLFSGATPYVTYGNKIIVSLCLLILTIIIALTKFTPAVRDKYG